ncbi:hypothetical protein M9H77_10430 [Catharanthus roseus]|uniref:Uncharacterized protein n=1 Tax=Catharanthus roseus TaxID=4058 RepID=A0ACC0BBP5_CATRO|nr:hypothetical protein M9H77_10430 [Catharanthus roseus]
MAFSTSSISPKYASFSRPIFSSLPQQQQNSSSRSIIIRCLRLATRCESKQPWKENGSKKLGIGSPIVIIEAPQMIKTAASVPCLRVNSGLVKPGDVGRIVSRKPKDVWVVRLTIGTYLIDGKYFKALEIDE